MRSIPTGGTEVVFGAARNPAAAVSLTTFCLIWTGFIWLFASFAPRITAMRIFVGFFVIVMAAFDALFLLAALDLWCGVTRVAIMPGTVKVTHGPFGWGPTNIISASDIAGITTQIGLQTGQTPYYDIEIVKTGGRQVTAGSAIKDKQEAEHLVAQMKTWIGQPTS